MSKKAIDKRVGLKIRRLRDAQGYSQEYVADEIGMSFGNLGKIERGEVDPKTATLYKLAKILKVNIADFFEGGNLVAEPKEKIGYVTKDELTQSNLEIINLFKAEFAKLREELSIKKESYKLKNKSRKSKK